MLLNTIPLQIPWSLKITKISRQCVLHCHSVLCRRVAVNVCYCISHRKANEGLLALSQEDTMPISMRQLAYGKHPSHASSSSPINSQCLSVRVVGLQCQVWALASWAERSLWSTYSQIPWVRAPSGSMATLNITSYPQVMSCQLVFKGHLLCPFLQDVILVLGVPRMCLWSFSPKYPTDHLL